MNRTYAAMILATAVALPLGACSGDDSGGYYDYGPPVGCGQYTTCGACTPVPGCGWCFNATGGVCTTDPHACAQVTSEFTWTWDPSGCPDADVRVAPSDAAAHANDAGAPHVDAGAAQSDTGTPSNDTGTAPSDTGTAPSDTGAAPSDSGTAPSDSATPPADTGASPSDASPD
jgi:hypothetical protein